MSTKKVTFTFEEKVNLGAILSGEIKKAYKVKEVCGMEPVYNPEELKKLYKKVTGIEWEA